MSSQAQGFFASLIEQGLPRKCFERGGQTIIKFSFLKPYSACIWRPMQSVMQN